MNRKVVIAIVIIVVLIGVYFLWWKPKKDAEKATKDIEKEITNLKNGNTGVAGGANPTGKDGTVVTGGNAIEEKTKELEMAVEQAATIGAKVKAKDKLDKFTDSIKAGQDGVLRATV